MPTTANFGKEYSDFWEGHSETFSCERQECVRPVLLHWQDRAIAITDFLGFSVRSGTSGISRVLPNKHPEYPWLWATQCAVQPRAMGLVGNNGIDGFISYADTVPAQNCSCLINVTYQNLDYILFSDQEMVDIPAAAAVGEVARYVTKTSTLATESLPITGNTFALVDDAVQQNREPIKEPMAIHGGILTIQYSWHQVPFAPVPNILAMIGKVNTATFDNMGAFNWNGVSYPARPGYAAQTMLLVGADWRETHSPSRHPQAEISYHWMWRGAPSGATWNKVYRRSGPGDVGGPGFYAYTAKGTGGDKGTTLGDPLYSSGNMYTLFELA